ncbi:MAG: hypothetical protein HRS57_01430 [Mycoplasmataceae bacterium]|nr:hypothetical protein [Mycoplasmataceae bacterium]
MLDINKKLNKIPVILSTMLISVGLIVIFSGFIKTFVSSGTATSWMSVISIGILLLSYLINISYRLLGHTEDRKEYILTINAVKSFMLLSIFLSAITFIDVYVQVGNLMLSNYHSAMIASVVFSTITFILVLGCIAYGIDEDVSDFKIYEIAMSFIVILSILALGATGILFAIDAPNLSSSASTGVLVSDLYRSGGIVLSVGVGLIIYYFSSTFIAKKYFNKEF